MLDCDTIVKKCQFVSENSSDVQIDDDALKKFSLSLQQTPVQYWTKNNLAIITSNMTLEEKLRLMFLFGVTSFCYWTKPDWGYDDMGCAMSLLKAYGIAMKSDNMPFSSNLTLGKYKSIVDINKYVKIDFLEERWKLLIQAINIIETKYMGKILNLLEQAGFDCIKLLNIFVEEFEGYNDRYDYLGRDIPILKKAQLTISDFCQSYKDVNDIVFTNYDKMTACADYRIPQILRHFGVLRYSESLSYLIDNNIEIKKGDYKEIEIRALTVKAVEDMKRHLPFLTSMEINDMIWLTSIYDDGLKPHHKTITFFY